MLQGDDGAESGLVMVSRWRADRKETTPVSQSRIKSPSSSSSSPEAPVLTTKTGTVLPFCISPLNAFKQGLFSLFVENGFPADNNSFQLPFCERSDWMVRVINLPTLTPALDNALLAVCTARLGRHVGRTDLVHQSLQLYTKGLSELSREAFGSTTQGDEQRLACCLAFLMYEITECPGGTPEGYEAHYRGTMQLLHAGGAGAHTSGLAHSVFQSIRMHAVSIELPFVAPRLPSPGGTARLTVWTYYRCFRVL